MSATPWVMLATGAAAGAGVLAAAGRRRWQARSATLLAALEAACIPAAVRPFLDEDLAGLPSPVARYLRRVLRPGQPSIVSARLAQDGLFDAGTRRANWRPFCASQGISVRRPGFVWDARIRMAPGLAIRVHDAYVNGTGILEAALGGLLPVARLEGGGAVAEGELIRALAEAPWTPTALLPDERLAWSAIDERSARATLRDGPNAASLIFRFGADELVESVHAEARGRSVGDRLVPTPWEGRWTRYAERHGMWIPVEGEAAWMLPAGRRPYWRGRLTALELRFAATPGA